MRLGIMGGTFDPIHYGHLFTAEEARVRFRLNNVLFIPNGNPPHKKDYPLTPARHRYAMTLIATHANRAFGCSPIEMNRPGPSYAVDTLTLLREQNPDAELYYITGIDAVLDILSWRRHEDVIRLAAFIAAPRPGFDLKILKDRLPHEYLERILLLGSTALGISSTEIRERVQKNLPVRYLLPDGVLDYIVKHGLYTQRAPENAGAEQAGENLVTKRTLGFETIPSDPAAADAPMERDRMPDEETLPVAPPASELDSEEKARLMAAAADSVRAEDIVVLDLRKLTIIADFFVVCTGKSSIQQRAIADRMEERLREHGLRKLRVEGYQEATWILLDYGDVVAHVMAAEQRDFYNLEAFWSEAPRLELDLTPEPGGTPNRA